MLEFNLVNQVFCIDILVVIVNYLNFSFWDFLKGHVSM